MVNFIYLNTAFLHFYLNSEPFTIHIFKSKFISMVIWGWRRWKIKKLQKNLSIFMKENTVSTFSVKWQVLAFMGEIISFLKDTQKRRSQDIRDASSEVRNPERILCCTWKATVKTKEQTTEYWRSSQVPLTRHPLSPSPSTEPNSSPCTWTQKLPIVTRL